MARHMRGVDADHQRSVAPRSSRAAEHEVHAGHRQRRAGVDRDDARAGVRAGHQRDVPHARRIDIGDKVALAR